MINLLILSVGTRNKVVQYFKKALTDEQGNKKGKVVVTDMSYLAPAIYEADKFYKVPKITEERYIDILIDICKKEDIKAILSLIDPELSIITKQAEKFRKIGVTIIGSSYDLCEMSLDKMKMCGWLRSNGFHTAKSYSKWESFYEDLNKGEINFPVFIKPIKGSASIEINKVEDIETAKCIFEKTDNLMIQEFLNGQEIGADVYIDMISGETVSIFLKKKLVMRAGETNKSVSFKDENLFQLIQEFVKKAGYKGQIDIDIFEIDGKYYISEVNPRFGGGYPHAFECGCDHMTLIINNLQGIINERSIGQYEEGIYMMKYNEVLVKRKLGVGSYD